MPHLPRPVDRALEKNFRFGQSTEPNYSGVQSFLRRRLVHDPAEATGADALVWGVPLDVAVSNRPGTRFGPRSIREASTILDGDPVYPFGFDIFETLDVADTGDCVFDYGLPQGIPAHIEAQAKARLEVTRQLVTLGGDHFITYPILKALTQTLGQPVALVHFDAHQDTWDDAGDRIDHGTFVTRAVREGLILPEKSIQIGIRTHAPHDFGIGIVSGLQAHERGVKAITQAILERVGQTPAYISFDIDALDPAFAPGTGTPVCGGLSTAQATAILRELSVLDLAGFDVVEVSPPYDHAGITSLAAATLAQIYLGLLATRKNDV
jgi:agmatinase